MLDSSSNFDLPFDYMHNTLFQYFQQEDFFTLRTNFVIYHSYFPDESNNIPSQLKVINTYVSNQWNAQYSPLPYPVNIQ